MMPQWDVYWSGLHEGSLQAGCVTIEAETFQAAKREARRQLANVEALRTGRHPIDVRVGMSWAPEVIADSTGKFVGNALRFATKAEAEAQVRDLAWRWTSVRGTRVVESVDPVNYAYVDGRLVPVTEVKPDPTRQLSGKTASQMISDEPTTLDPRDPDPSRPGIFRDHNCYKCQDGNKPCVAGAPSRCEYPRARND